MIKKTYHQLFLRGGGRKGEEGRSADRYLGNTQIYIHINSSVCSTSWRFKSSTCNYHADYSRSPVKRFLFSFHLTEIQSYWQFSFWLRTKWNSVWFLIKTKVSLRFHSSQFEDKLKSSSVKSVFTYTRSIRNVNSRHAFTFIYIYITHIYFSEPRLIWIGLFAQTYIARDSVQYSWKYTNGNISIY